MLRVGNIRSYVSDGPRSILCPVSCGGGFIPGPVRRTLSCVVGSCCVTSCRRSPWFLLFCFLHPCPSFLRSSHLPFVCMWTWVSLQSTPAKQQTTQGEKNKRGFGCARLVLPRPSQRHCLSSKRIRNSGVALENLNRHPHLLK